MTLSVHPRLRGELFARKGDEIGYTGSSPLTRGTQGYTAPDGHLVRFIPAYAGNSVKAQADEQLDAVHPRLRGELVLVSVFDKVAGRFIPAYAGNSRFTLFPDSSITVHPRLRGEL